MSQFRNFCNKIFIVSFVCTGLLAGTLRVSYFTNTNSSFTNWFASLIEENENFEIKKRIASLKYSQDNLNNIIVEATKLVEDNYEAFSLPIPDGFRQGPEELFYLLISHWNSSENNETLILLPFQKWLKTIDLSPQKYIVKTVKDSFLTQRYLSNYVSLNLDFENLPICIIPLVHCITIGAP